MPGEFEPHEGTLMIWPWRPGSWNYGAFAIKSLNPNVKVYGVQAHLQKLQKQLPPMSRFIFSSGHRIKHRHRNCFPPTGFI